MKKQILPLVLGITLILALVPAGTSFAGDLDDEIKELREQVKEKQQKQEDLQKKIEENEQEQRQIQQQLDQLEESLEKTKAKIQQLNEEIAETEQELEQTKAELEEAEARVAKRTDILKERVRLMYKNGDVAYLEVLLGATDFADFLARFESIQTIMDQDKKLLAAQKRDRDIIAQSKADIEISLAKLNTLEQEAQNQRDVLAQKQEEQKVVLASLQKEEDRLAEINEKAAQQEREAAAQLAAKLEEQKRLSAPKRPASSGGSSGGYHDSGGTLAWPANGTFTSGFGPRWGRQHKGIDVAAPVGTPIYAAEDGVVTSAGPSSGYGNKITIAHGNGISTLYAHMYSSGILVKPGQKVKRGDKIAEIGNAGRSTGPHVHFEVLRGSTPTNPMNYLN